MALVRATSRKPASCSSPHPGIETEEHTAVVAVAHRSRGRRSCASDDGAERGRFWSKRPGLPVVRRRSDVLVFSGGTQPSLEGSRHTRAWIRCGRCSRRPSETNDDADLWLPLFRHRRCPGPNTGRTRPMTRISMPRSNPHHNAADAHLRIRRAEGTWVRREVQNDRVYLGGGKTGVSGCAVDDRTGVAWQRHPVALWFSPRAWFWFPQPGSHGSPVWAGGLPLRRHFDCSRSFLPFFRVMNALTERLHDCRRRRCYGPLSPEPC